MLSKIIEFALSQRLLILVLSLLIAGAGGYSFSKLPIDAFPDISPTQVKIILKAPGMTPEEVEQRINMPLEMELLGIPKQTILRSVAKYAIADVTIDFEEGTDVYWARQQVAERLAGVMDILPVTVSGGLAPISTPLSDVFMFTIEGGGLSLEERRTLLDWTIRPALRTLPGVADVNALGGRVRTFEVVPNNAALLGAGLTVADLKDAIEMANRNDGAGRLDDGEEGLIVRAVGAIQTLDDLRQIVVSQNHGHVLRVQDLAKVRFGSLTRYGAVTKNGQGEAVEGLVLALRGADARAVVDEVKARIKELKPSLPEGVNINVFYDRSTLIERAVGTVSSALVEATVLVVVLLLLFLGNVRAALVVAVTLPFAALITFMMMRTFGLTANLMSLGGLAIAIGMLVDAAVVVVENTVEHLAHHKKEAKVPALHRVYRATTEVAVPVASGILIICLVFLPLLSLQGLEGKLFAPVALTIVFALSGSLVLSLTLIPVLSSFALKAGAHADPWLMRQIMPRYRKLLDMALNRPSPVYALAGVGLIAAVISYMAVGKTFMPTMDEGAILLQTTKLPSVNLNRSTKGDLSVEQAVMKAVPEVTGVYARLGSDELGLDPMGLNESDIFLTLKPKEEWRKPDKVWLTDQIRQVMDNYPGVDFAFTQPIEMRVSEMLTGSRGDLAIKVFGPDLKVLGKLAGEIQKVVGSINGAAEVMTVANDNVQYLQVGINRLAAGAAGLKISDVQDELRAQLEGTRAGYVAKLNRRIPILIRGEGDVRDRPEVFENHMMATPNGGMVRLSDIAHISMPEGAVKIDRENASRFAVIQAYVSGRDLVGFVQDAQAQVAAKVPLPPGYRLVWGGQFENQKRAAARLAIVVPLAIALIFLVLFATLRSVRQSMLILANIPFALVGGVVALWISGQYLSVPASVGFIALLGIAVLNGLVLVAHFNQLIALGMDARSVVFEGAQRRLRPVLMTACITAFGLIPLLFATGPGSEIQKPLAIVVIGGLASSTLLTLFLLPILFRRFGAVPEVTSLSVERSDA
ncbi:efflux RND transporter permease subunit [Kordiimonas marina]|uniref:efflux RND transporter permease subunit n=1 Tax=Kordiimonas marina TaxID=2872312 RepID=UPI001FF24ACF|nr:CusA/CzcA family heavy metal efflux RND transporter [Kordiimonas marina]MCJ9428850.1 CusA/CzcA family heavy metal efflux RND transporter [Kordiimonas marina]